MAGVHSMAPHRHSPTPLRTYTLALCCLLAAAWGATKAQAATPRQDCDLLAEPTAPKMMLSSQNQTLFDILLKIIKDPYGAGACCNALLYYAHADSLIESDLN